MHSIMTTFLRYRFLLGNLITRDLKVKYRRSFLGILWSMLNPLLIMLVLNAVFSNLFKAAMTENFPLYLISGQTLYSFFTEATNGALVSVVDSSALIKKVYIPKYIFPLEKVLFSFVNLLFSLIAVFVMMLIYGIKPAFSMLLIPIPLLTMAMFATGMGLILATLCVFFRDIRHLYSVLTTAWLYLTPIFYPMDLLGDSFIFKIVKYNPLTYYISYFRNVALFSTLPTLEDNLFCFGYGVVFTIIGIVIFKAKQDKFVLHI
jgi:ABC-2 type transport system permease protein